MGEAIQRQVKSCELRTANGSKQNRSWGPANGRIFKKNVFVVKRLCTWYSLVTQQFA